MNVCYLCGGDGVMQSCGHWYCMDHVTDGFIATAAYIARLRGHPEQPAEDLALEVGAQL